MKKPLTLVSRGSVPEEVEGETKELVYLVDGH